MHADQKLAIDSVDGNYVLPQPPRGHGEVIVVSGAEGRRAGLLRGQQVAMAFGQRMVQQSEGMQVLLEQVRERLDGLDSTIAEASRAQLKGAVRELGSMLEWCAAAQRELFEEGSRACEGCEPVDVVSLCREVAASHDDPSAPTSVHAEGSVTWWGRAIELHDLLDLAMVLVAERTRGSGARHLDVACTTDGVRVKVHGFGEPSDTVEAVDVARFRRAADELGVSVSPGVFGAGGAGMVLHLPR
ncbi:MAG: hypothetical protein H6835_02525 [Planctomycetes bacterium]|nr:hypothetical protein [Planctomycetota bacterium]